MNGKGIIDTNEHFDLVCINEQEDEWVGGGGRHTHTHTESTIS